MAVTSAASDAAASAALTITVPAWSFDQWLGILGLVFGLLGLAATLLAAWDSRRQRTRREKAVIVAHEVVERTYGLLIGLKPPVAALGQMYEEAMNDGLAAIDERRGDLSNL
ncbi:hypothetical protein [Caballeronia sordidicola]|uniref:Uncharacterized protein n=1 Tax=Caballeronia sordidicola TaxID=196367 RepID=A0A226WRM0_CABSO|nr:hypothetical protein [Caballeronia sordidicola]OXC73831.1 hypothetical protein BSU04_34965 [Caballeronia sordidicola]